MKMPTDRLASIYDYLMKNGDIIGVSDFAQKIDVDQPNISAMLNGKRTVTPKTVSNIIAAFPQFSRPWMLSGEGSMLVGENTIAPVPPVVSSAEAKEAAKAKADAARVAALEQQLAELHSEVQILLMEKEKYKQLLEAQDATIKAKDEAIQSKDALLKSKDNIIALLTKPLSTSPTAKERGKVGSRVGSM
jgi:hypothetical protein